MTCGRRHPLPGGSKRHVGDPTLGGGMVTIVLFWSVKGCACLTSEIIIRGHHLPLVCGARKVENTEDFEAGEKKFKLYFYF